MRLHWSIAIAALTSACFSEPPPSTGSEDGEGTDDTGFQDSLQPMSAETAGTQSTDGLGEDTSIQTGDTPPDDTGEDPSQGTTVEPPANICGDGDLGPAEECDDANDRAGDGCSPDCRTETTGCAAGSEAVADDMRAGIAVCRDPDETTCEEDFSDLCAPGWHLCSAREHMAKNDRWVVGLDGRRALGVIRCRVAGGAGHYTVANTELDGSDNCQIGSSRAECPSAFGCNETSDYALCCAPIPSCGNGVVDDPDEECDDANDDPTDDCSNDCANKRGTGTDC